MPRRVEPDPSTWWETYGHRLEGPPVTPRPSGQDPGVPGPDAALPDDPGPGRSEAPGAYDDRTTGGAYPDPARAAGQEPGYGGGPGSAYGPDQDPMYDTGPEQARGAARPQAEGPPTQSPPTQGVPPQGPPTQGPPTQGPPTQGPPTQGPPTQGPPTQSPPTQGVPPQASPTQGPPPQRLSPQDRPHQDPPHGPPPQGPPPQGWPGQSMPPEFAASGLSEDVVLRPRAARPGHGWRRVLFELTGGRLNPGPGAAEEAREALLARIRGPLAGAHRVAVTSIKGGVGKTTVATCLGLTLAENRGDRAVVLDANPDAGTLADRLTGDARITVRELLDDLDQVHTWTDVSRYTSLAGRLQVLASEQDPAAGEAFRRDEYERIAALLGRFFNIIVTDSGTGLVHSAMEGTLAAADSLVVVGAPTVDGASRASKTLDWLVAHDHGALARDAVVVLCCDRSSAEVDGGRIRDHFAGRARGVVEIPHDPHLATGGRVDLTRLRPATADAFLELGALIGDAFDVRPARGYPGPPMARAPGPR